MHSALTADELLPVSWRSRPGDFVSLMTLYESNYFRLRRLVPDVATMVGSATSLVTNDCPLHLRVEDRGRYTTTFTLTYLFDSVAGQYADPDLQVRVYHDARVAEVLSCARWHRHEVLAAIKNHLYSRHWLRHVYLRGNLNYLKKLQLNC